MPDISGQDWQQIALAYANENIMLKARLAAVVRMLSEIQRTHPPSENGAKEKGNVPVSQGQIQEDNQ